MKKKQLIPAALLVLLAACGNPKNNETTEDVTVIDVAGAVENLQELKLSQLGSTVRYVPLETNDSCLIGNNPSIMVLDKHILVFSNKNVHCFDKETGRFLNAIGHVGQDPKGYSQSNPAYYNDRNGLLYFVRRPDQLQKYDLQGRYRGKVTIPTPPDVPTNYAFIDTLLVGYYNNLAQQNKHSRLLGFFTEGGVLADTVDNLLPSPPPMEMSDLMSFSVYRLGNAHALVSQFKDGTSSISLNTPAPLWRYKDRLRFKDAFNDTVYNVTAPGRLEPALLFNTGKYHMDAKERWEPSDVEDKVNPIFTLETDHALFFQCAQGLTKALNGVYDKRTGTTRMNLEKEGFADDIHGFRPFKPSACSPQGEFAQIVDVMTVQGWLDEHPEAKDKAALAPLLRLGEEDNPVVVLVR